MKSTDDALSKLGSVHFFDVLRGILRDLGLGGQSKFGIALFVVALSRYFTTPLRLHVQQSTKGSAAFLVRSVAKLLPKNHRVGIYRDLADAWSSFEDSPNDKLVWVPPAPEVPHQGSKLHIDIDGNQITGIWPLQQDGRVVENTRTVQGRFVCVSGEAPPFSMNRTRWLTMRLPSPEQVAPGGITAPDEEELAVWHEVQRLIGERAQLQVVLPGWEELFIEQMFQDSRAQRHLPAFLTSWKTMCVLRSFQNDTGKMHEKFLQADFASLAATGALLRVFREGCWFRSVQKIYEQISRAGDRATLLNPVTGKPMKYVNDGLGKPGGFHSLLSR